MTEEQICANCGATVEYVADEARCTRCGSLITNQNSDKIRISDR